MENITQTRRVMRCVVNKGMLKVLVVLRLSLAFDLGLFSTVIDLSMMVIVIIASFKEWVFWEVIGLGSS